MGGGFFGPVQDVPIGRGKPPIILTCDLVHGQDDLLEFVFVFESARGGSDPLDGAQQQAHQNRQDGDHDKKLDQRKSRAMAIHERLRM